MNPTEPTHLAGPTIEHVGHLDLDILDAHYDVSRCVTTFRVNSADRSAIGVDPSAAGPIRKGQFVMFPGCHHQTRIAAVGEGTIEIADWAWMASGCNHHGRDTPAPDYMIRPAQHTATFPAHDDDPPLTVSFCSASYRKDPDPHRTAKHLRKAAFDDRLWGTMPTPEE